MTADRRRSPRPISSSDPATVSHTAAAISATVRLLASVPMLKARQEIERAGASMHTANARAMSLACTNGRHRVPPESTRTTPDSTA